jgi:hypothetical protein
MTAAAVVIVCFFLPWISVSCTSYGLLGDDRERTWSGYEIAAGTMDLTRDVDVGETALLYVTPVAAGLAFVLILFTGRRRLGGWLAAVLTMLAAAGGGALGAIYANVGEELQEFVSAASEYGQAGYKLELGLWGTAIGLVAIVAGAIADAFARD